MKVVIIIEDKGNGQTSVTSAPSFDQMSSKTRRGLMADSMAAAFALAALTKIAHDARLLKEKGIRPKIILPPGIRG